MKHRVIGIDLGTTYSAVAAFDLDEEQAEVIVDRSEADAATTPSVVAYDPVSEKVTVGWQAKRNLPNNPENTIIEIKREMGKVAPGPVDPAQADPLTVRFAGQDCLPQFISAFTLRKMKEIAEAEIGEEIRDAVITVPAWFPEPQRGATKQASLLAGLYPRQLIPEPTAAAICYAVDTDDPAPRAYLVFDLGGGTFDVSIIKGAQLDFDVIATTGDQRLGGGDFDNSVTEWAVQELRDQHGVEIGDDARARALIKFHAEQAKMRLAAAQSTDLVLPELRPAEPPVLTLTREKFVELITPDLRKSLTAVDAALNIAAKEKNVREDEIDAVLLVGGSTRIPEVRNMLLERFPGRDESFVRSGLNPAAVVARGAAILGYQFSPTEHPFDVRGQPDATLVNLEAAEVVRVIPITEHSLSVGVQENRCVRMIDRGTNIPTSTTQHQFTNAAPTGPPPADKLEARVFQGEGEYQYENAYIGSVWIENLPPRGPREYDFDVTYALDKNGLLSVEVKEVQLDQTWEANFEHASHVKSEDELVVLHNRVKEMFAGTAVAAGPEQPQPVEVAGTYVPPPATAAEPASAPVADTAPPPAPAADGDQPEAPAQAVEHAASAQPAEEGDSADARADGQIKLVELDSAAAPAEFRPYVRRARRHLEETFDEELAKAFNDFAVAVNTQVPEDELIDLGDALTEALDDARRGRS